MASTAEYREKGLVSFLENPNENQAEKIKPQQEAVLGERVQAIVNNSKLSPEEKERDIKAAATKNIESTHPGTSKDAVESEASKFAKECMDTPAKEGVFFLETIKQLVGGLKDRLDRIEQTIRQVSGMRAGFEKHKASNTSGLSNQAKKQELGR